MVDLELLSGPFLFLFLLLLNGAGALIFFLILFNSQLGYLQDVSAFWRCSCSSSRCCLVEHTALALGNNVLMTLYLPVMAWWVSHCKYWLVWVGFLYTVVSILPSLEGVTRVSRKGIDPSILVFSAVNWMPLFYGIYVVEEFFFVGCFYDNQRCHQQIFPTDLGVYGAELRALVSKSSMKMLAIMGLMITPLLLPLFVHKISLENKISALQEEF